MRKNLTFGIWDTNWLRTDRIAEAGSLSLHSSKASITMTVEIPDFLRGPTINLFIWLERDSWMIPGFDRTSGVKIDRISVYLHASWTAIVGSINWRLAQSE